MDLRASIDGYLRHLDLDRGFSAHTIRGYRTDLLDLAGYAADAGHDDTSGIDLELLRGWLWRGSSAGLAKATLARRSAAARGYTKWLARTGETEADSGSRLKAPRPDRHLPRVLTRSQVDAMNF